MTDHTIYVVWKLCGEETAQTYTYWREVGEFESEYAYVAPRAERLGARWGAGTYKVFRKHDSSISDVKVAARTEYYGIEDLEAEEVIPL